MAKKSIKSTHKNAYKPRGKLFLGLVMLGLIGFLIFSTVFATAKDIETIGDIEISDNYIYNKTLREVTILDSKNSSAKIRLDTEQTKQIPFAGYRQLFRLELDNQITSSQFIKEEEYFDLKDNNKTIDVDVDFYIITYSTIQVQNWENHCVNKTIKINGTDTEVTDYCYDLLNGMKPKTIENKVPYNIKSIPPKGKYAIEGWSWVKPGEYREWIYTFELENKEARVSQWASWNVSFDDYKLYYNFEEGSGSTAADLLGNNDLTVNSTTWNSSGFIGSAYNFNTNDTGIELNNLPNSSWTGVTINMWVKRTGNWQDYDNKEALLFGSGVNDFSSGFVTAHFGNDELNNLEFNIYGGTDWFYRGTEVLPLDEWMMITLTYNSTSLSLYENATLSQRDGDNPRVWTTAIPFKDLFLFEDEAPSDYIYNITIDEVAIFDRVLNQQDVTALYGAGTGMTPLLDTANPDITIVSPTNLSTTGDTGIDIEYIATDDAAIDSCWWSNDSGANNYSLADCDTNVTTPVWALGSHTIEVWAKDTSNKENSTTVTFTVQGSLIDLLFTNKSDLIINKTIFDEGENFETWGNWSNDNGNAINDSGSECNFTFYDVVMERVSGNQTFTICNSGCDFTSVREEFVMEVSNQSTEVIEDFVKLEVCHLQNNNQDLSLTVECLSGTDNLIVDAAEFGLCSSGYSEVFVPTTACKDSLSINISLTNTAPLVSGHNLSEFQLDRRLTKHTDTYADGDVSFNTTFNLWQPHQTYESYEHGQVQVDLNCSSTTTNYNNEITRNITIVNTAPQILPGEVFLPSGLGYMINETTQDNANTIEYEKDEWRFIMPIVDDDLDYHNETIYTINNISVSSTLHNDPSSDHNTTNATFISFISDQPYNLTIWANDTAGNYTEVSFYFLVNDTIAPDFVNSTPTNQNLNQGEEINYDIDATDKGVGVETYTLNDTSFLSIDGLGTITNTTVIPFGTHEFILSVNDSNGNINSTTWTLTVLDIINPDLAITFPTDYTNSTDNSLNVNWTYFDVNIANCWYSNNSGQNNQSIADCDTNLTGKTWEEGSNTVIVYANDSSGNENSSSVIFTIDTLAPIINITTPINGTEQTTENLEIEYTIIESTLDSCWWTNDSGLINYTLDCTQNIKGQNWSVGVNIVDIWANDSFNYNNYTSVTFNMSLQNPIISPGYTDGGGTFTGVVNRTFFNNGSVNITGNISDIMPGLDNTTLILRNASGDIINTTTESQGGVLNILWGIPFFLLEGIYTFQFQAFDTISNFQESAIYTFFIDETNPNIMGSDLSIGWVRTDPNMYTLNATYTELYLNETGISVDGVNFTPTKINDTDFYYSITENFTAIPHGKQFYWWGYDNATNYGQSADYDFNLTCPDAWSVFNNSYCMEKLNFTGIQNENITRYIDLVKEGVITSLIFNLSGSGFNDNRINISYDNLNDGIINFSLWTNTSTGEPDCASSGRNSSIIESGGILSSHSEVCGWDSAGFENSYTQSKIFPSYTQLENITIRHLINRVDSAGSGCGVNSDSKIILFGNTLHNGDQSYNAIWIARRNLTAGIDKFAVYKDGTFNTTITASDSLIKAESNCYGTSGSGANHGYLESNLDYIKYTNALNNTLVSISINGTDIFNTTARDFNSLQNQTPNIATKLRNYLLDCNAVDGNCLVPFIFNMDSKQGILEVYGIETSNEGFLETSQTYNTTTTEGNIENFQINLTYDSVAYPNIEGTLFYNGTQNVGIKTGSGNNVIFSTDIAIPSVSAQREVDFYWQITLINDTRTNFNSTTNNQTIRNLGIDGCSAHSILLLNVTLLDEDAQTVIDAAAKNSTVDIDVDIYSKGVRSAAVIEFSGNFTANNNPQICLENDLGNSEYEMDVQIKYDGDDYAAEYSHIQNFTLINSSLPQNVKIYDLLDSRATSFKISFKDANFLAVEDAIIQIQRKYVDEGVYKSIEIPKTDAKGEAVASLIRNEIIYTIMVLKNGELLGTFNDVVAVCQNPTIETCTIPLNAFSTGVSVEDFSKSDDLVYTMSFDRDTRTVQTIYSIPSGASPSMKLNTTLADDLGVLEACSDTLESPAGTLTCVIPISVGNGTATITLTKNDNVEGFATIDLSPTPGELYGASLVFLGIFLIMTLVGVGVQSNSMITGIFLILGSILLIILNIVDTGLSPFIGGGATVLWLIMAIILVLIKGSRRQ